MPRIARVVAPGYPHHITQRGNYQQNVFEDENDFKQYLFWLKEYSTKYYLRIWAYCLMINHVHFVCIPDRADSLSKTFNTLHMRYSQYFNAKKKVKGHLWQGWFFSCMLDEKHLYSAIRYIENNPVRANIVNSPEKYRWSSTAGHIRKSNDLVLSGDCYLESKVKDWLAYLKQQEDKQFIQDIKKSTITGRPCGDDLFIQSIENVIGRRLKALPHGRPRKKKK